MGSSPSTPKQADPVVEEEKAKKKALALAQAYEAKTAALGTASTKLVGTERNTQEVNQTHLTEAEKVSSALKNGDAADLTWAKETGKADAGKNTALKGFDAYVPGSTNAKTAAGVYESTTRNERNQNAALLEYTRRKREPQALVMP